MLTLLFVRMPMDTLPATVQHFLPVCSSSAVYEYAIGHMYSMDS